MYVMLESMEFFNNQLPPNLDALPKAAKGELAALLMRADDGTVQLSADTEAKIREVLSRIDHGSEPMMPADQLIQALRAKFV